MGLDTAKEDICLMHGILDNYLLILICVYIMFILTTLCAALSNCSGDLPAYIYSQLILSSINIFCLCKLD